MLNSFTSWEVEAMALTDEQIERYSRHIILKEVGAKGQKKLLNAKVLRRYLLKKIGI